MNAARGSRRCGGGRRWPLGGEGPESRLWRGIASEIERQRERGKGVWGFLTTSPSSGDERAAKRHGGAADRRRRHTGAVLGGGGAEL